MLAPRPLSIATFPIGEPMLTTPMPLAASLVLIFVPQRLQHPEVHDILALDPAKLEMGDLVFPTDADLLVKIRGNLIGEGGKFEHAGMVRGALGGAVRDAALVPSPGTPGEGYHIPKGISAD